MYVDVALRPTYLLHTRIRAEYEKWKSTVMIVMFSHFVHTIFYIWCTSLLYIFNIHLLYLDIRLRYIEHCIGEESLHFHFYVYSSFLFISFSFLLVETSQERSRGRKKLKVRELKRTFHIWKMWKVTSSSSLSTRFASFFLSSLSFLSPLSLFVFTYH